MKCISLKTYLAFINLLYLKFKKHLVCVVGQVSNQVSQSTQPGSLVIKYTAASLAAGDTALNKGEQRMTMRKTPDLTEFAFWQLFNPFGSCKSNNLKF